MTTPEKRRSRRYAIAFAFGLDIGDVSEYQPTRRGWRVPIYQADGAGVEFAIALRDGEVPPSDYEWTPKEWAFGYRILYVKEAR